MKNDALIFLVLYKSQLNIKEKTLIGYLNLNSIIYGKSLIENDESRVQTSFSSNWWLIEKRFYKRETIRGIIISLLAEIPPLFHDWLI